jgi:hypothetical protein
MEVIVTTKVIDEQGRIDDSTEVPHAAEIDGDPRSAIKDAMSRAADSIARQFKEEGADAFDLTVEIVRETVRCKLCERQVPQSTAHRHQGEWVGDECCWDERLRATE